MGFRVEFFWGLGLGLRAEELSTLRSVSLDAMREFPKIRDTLFWGSYNKDPTI